MYASDQVQDFMQVKYNNIYVGILNIGKVHVNLIDSKLNSFFYW